MRYGDLQPQHDLVAVQLSGSCEAVSLVERDRAALALPGARPHGADAPAPEVLDDQVERRRTEAPSLVALVDEQLPEEVGDVVGAADLVGDHHEPDRRLVGIDRPVEGPSVRLLRRLEHRLADTADEPSLSRRDGKGLDSCPIRVGDRPQRNHRVRLDHPLRCHCRTVRSSAAGTRRASRVRRRRAVCASPSRLRPGAASPPRPRPGRARRCRA